MDLLAREMAVIQKAHSLNLNIPLNIPNLEGCDFNHLVNEIGYMRFFQTMQALNHNLVNKCVMEELWAILTRAKALEKWGVNSIKESKLADKKLVRSKMSEMEMACIDSWAEIFRGGKGYARYRESNPPQTSALQETHHVEIEAWWDKIKDDAYKRGIIINNTWVFNATYHLDPDQNRDLQEHALYSKAASRVSEEEKVTEALGKLAVRA
ncbi:hypothetical protein HYFRA_00012786 [Hymenoscyphus fraxineus]|uniref:Uncharacterized protein n=1 Tax=Hymenoscyphus fraxineus TaxID=746836 RepID=A0A9N9L552_9HELO|nr:hypothetical protein HYFRA_00012786 [Hymenoscyphus fraxineus]